MLDSETTKDQRLKESHDLLNKISEEKRQLEEILATKEETLTQMSNQVRSWHVSLSCDT